MDQRFRLIFYAVSTAFVVATIAYALKLIPFFGSRQAGPFQTEFVRVLTGGSDVSTEGASLNASWFFQTQPDRGMVIGRSWSQFIPELRDQNAPFTCVIHGADLLKCEFVSKGKIGENNKLFMLTSFGRSVDALKIQYSLHVLTDTAVERLIINNSEVDLNQGRVFLIQLDDKNNFLSLEQRKSRPFSWAGNKNLPLKTEEELCNRVIHWLKYEEAGSDK